MSFSQERREELRINLEAAQQAVKSASEDFSQVRDAQSPLPRLTVVTKFFPSSDVEALYSLGVRHVGENRDQEASAKAIELAEITDAQDPLQWSYIGQLQTNKAKSVVKYAAEVHSVDRISLAQALAKAYSLQVARWESEEAPAPFAAARGGLKCLVQVSLEDHDGSTAGHAAEGKRGGAHLNDLLKIADMLNSSAGLECSGVMAVAPLGMNPDAAFEKLYNISQKLREHHPSAQEISAGMSGDLEAAIRWGSTNVRIGSKIMGARPTA